ncbi:hypothetical protein C8R43DRAFT_1046875 [Mycena crocata]|nr:hypothetical protein C8R43DRAFT_1046875 [Mycena crocata]
MFPVTNEVGVTERRFNNLPPIPGLVPGQKQALASDGGSSSSASESYPYAHPREEGCLVTGDVDLSNEAAHFISAARSKLSERQIQLEHILTLLEEEYRIIPHEARVTGNGFSLEHQSNMAWLSVMLHKHHDNWATIAISPCLHDLCQLRDWFERSNDIRRTTLNAGLKDPGRDSYDACVSSIALQNSYELTVLHPAYFLMDKKPLSVVCMDGSRRDYFSTPEGILQDENGNAMPPFKLRREREEPLNPCLINFAAAVRFRRFQRIVPPLLTTLGPHARDLIRASQELHAAIIWKPPPREASKNRAASGEGEDEAPQYMSLEELDYELGGYGMSTFCFLSNPYSHHCRFC